MARSITVIPARANRTSSAENLPVQKRMAAYCRVSTDRLEQQSSYEAQVNFYTTYINGHPDYLLAGIYADEGISGTNTKKREQFNKLIEDCKAGKIDMIITKSISRFARNTLDTLNYVRMLKELGIGVIFEKENINTLDSKGEVLLTILSSLAQDESRSISENSTWGIRRRFDNVLYQAFINTFNALVENKDYFMEKWQQKKSREDFLQRYKAQQFMKILKNAEPIKEFDMDLFFTITEKMTVYQGEKIIVILLDGTEVEVVIE